MPYNNPCIIIIIACLGSAVNGCAMPIMGVVMAEMLAVLGLPMCIIPDPTEDPATYAA